MSVLSDSSLSDSSTSPSATEIDLRLPDTRAIDEAWHRIRPHIHETPVLRSTTFDRLAGAELFFKCECFQRVGAFKIRGAVNTVFSLDEAEASRGVVTHSSGNHGQAVALAARLRGIPATIVMPENATAVKIAAVEGYGAEVIRCEPTLAARESTAQACREERGLTLVHPYDEPRVVAGQASVARELLEAVPDLDAIVVPVGGGGLLAGTALQARRHHAPVRVIGAEPSGADDAARSFRSGVHEPMDDPRTLADGLRTRLGGLAFSILSDHVDTIITVSDEAIIAAMRALWERMKLVVEPSAAVPLAAILESDVDLSASRIGVVLTGGNVDLDRLPWTRTH
ncbi:MAG: pyridoxal-phosphate dependent enzyme [Acidobacteriota bacterium]